MCLPKKKKRTTSSAISESLLENGHGSPDVSPQRLLGGFGSVHVVTGPSRRPQGALSGWTPRRTGSPLLAGGLGGTWCRSCSAALRRQAPPGACARRGEPRTVVSIRRVRGLDHRTRKLQDTITALANARSPYTAHLPRSPRTRTISSSPPCTAHSRHPRRRGRSSDQASPPARVLRRLLAKTASIT